MAKKTKKQPKKSSQGGLVDDALDKSILAIPSSARMEMFLSLAAKRQKKTAAPKGS